MKPRLQNLATIFQAALVAILGTLSESCTFPSYLTSVGLWDTQIKDEGLSLNILYIFEGNRINIKEYGDVGVTDSYRTCTQSFSGDKYIVSGQMTTGSTYYVCMQFVRRSPYVVQYMYSDNNTYQDSRMCNDTSLVWSPWPLVHTGGMSEYVPCSLEGGFDIRDVYDSATGETVCSESSMAPRMESECVVGEGMLFSLRITDCRGSLHLAVNQEVFCLAAWHQFGYLFHVITDKHGGLWSKKIWLMRVPSSQADNFPVYVLKDIVIDTNVEVRASEYLRLNVTQINFPSLCEDESPRCDAPDVNCARTIDSDVCQKTCAICNYLLPVTECVFREPIRGEWQDSSVSYNRMVRLTTSRLYADDMPAFTCFNPGSSIPISTDKRPMYAVFRNGCKPRYSCLRSSRVSDSLLQYSLSQSLIWPYDTTVYSSDICDDSHFQDDPSPLGYRYRSDRQKNVILSVSPLQNRTLSSCGMPGAFNFSVHYTGTTGDCAGYMFACEVTQRLILVFDEPCGRLDKVQVFNCLGFHGDQQQHYVITESSTDARDLQCWIRRTDLLEGYYNNMYLLRPADCHEDTLTDVEYRRHPILASFLFARRTDDAETLCAEDYAGLAFPSTAVPPTTTTENPWINIPDVDVDDVLWENITNSGTTTTTAGTLTATADVTDTSHTVTVTTDIPHSSTLWSSEPSTINTDTISSGGSTLSQNGTVPMPMNTTAGTVGTTDNSWDGSTESSTTDGTVASTVPRRNGSLTTYTVTQSANATTEYWSQGVTGDMTTARNFSSVSSDDHNNSSGYYTTPTPGEESTTLTTSHQESTRHTVDLTSTGSSSTTTSSIITTTSVSSRASSTSTTTTPSDDPPTSILPVVDASNTADDISINMLYGALISIFMKCLL